MYKKLISLLLALIVVATICTIPALAADGTTQQKFYVSCWSIDASGKEYVAALGSAGEYPEWEDALNAIESHDVSGYTNYRFGIICGIDTETVYEISTDIVLPDNTYLLLGNTVITKPITIKGGINACVVFTEWCVLSGGNTVTNIDGGVILYARYEWKGNSQKWVYDPDTNPEGPGGNQNNNGSGIFPGYPFPDDILPHEKEDTILKDNPFADVNESDWFYNDLIFVYSHNLMVGTSTDPMLFSPNIPLTRGMVVTVLYRYVGSPDVTGLMNPFDDVPDGTWYTNAIKWAAGNGIVYGYGNGKFGPNDNITRQDMAVIMHRYEQISSKIPPDIVMDREFSDWNAIADWAKDAVNRLTTQGIISGKPNNLFDPKGDATRAEYATVLMRLLSGG